MESRRDRKEHYGHSKHNKFKWFVFIAFLGVMSLILITTFYGESIITGKSVDEIINSNNSILVGAELTIPSLKMEGEYGLIEITGTSNSILNIDGQEFSLSDIKKNIVILEDFKGKIFFDENKISTLEGKALGVTVNGVKVSNKNGKVVKVNSEDEIRYDSIKFKTDSYLKNIDYKTSGEIWLERNRQDKISLRSEYITLSNFLGTIRMENKKMHLDGIATGINILSSSRKISISHI